MLSKKLTKSMLKTTDNYISGLLKGGISTVGELLDEYPREYEDRTNVLDSFSLINVKEKNTILVTLVSINTTKTANNKLLTKAVLEDKNGFMSEAVWFNRKYLASQLQYSGGKKVLVSGKVKYAFGKVTFTSPDIETDLSKIEGKIEPIYSDINYIPSKWTSGKIGLLKSFISDYTETLPENIIRKYNFVSKAEAIYKIHFPKNNNDIEVAKKRLGYEELFDINYKAISTKYKKFITTAGRSLAIELNVDFVKEILSKLPFELTNHQKIALFQIFKDMEKDHAMQRLLEGDVGTGKTVVSVVAIIHSILETRKKGMGIQVALMAPTAILATQHFISMQKMLFEYGISTELLVGATTAKQKKEIKSKLKTGNIDVIIGTHALVQEDVLFLNLGLVIIDEQHRFGVKQREVLEKGLGNVGQYSFSRQISEDDFKKLDKIIIEEDFNKSDIKRENYFSIKEKGELFGLVRIRDLGNNEFELGHLWVTKEQRGKGIGKKLMSFALLESREKEKIFLTCDKQLEEYYISLGFESVIDFPQRFIDTLYWAESVGKEYVIMKLQDRKKLQMPGTIVPHSLNMTATPIPRTLALTLYGDQDLSVINEYPKGRKDIYTKVASTENARNQIELFVRNELEKGRQVFWVSPLVEESEKMDLANAINTYENLISIFDGFQVGLIHGKMKPKEKDEIMADFKDNKIQVLSATSVIEVGIDIPNASIICIEGAERFGLSQLHQIRGRVGRGKYQSYCYLFPSKGNKTERLQAMEQSNNGFELSEIDLELRGPGEVYGLRQSGVPDLKVASLTDLELISQIREDIEEMFNKKEK